VAAWEDAGEGWLEVVLAKKSHAGILDVEDRFEDGTEREARGWGHVVVEKERSVGRTGSRQEGKVTRYETKETEF
jgi:hypothetical protein